MQTTVKKNRTTIDIEDPYDFSDEEKIPPLELAILKTLADNSIEDWPQRPSRLIHHTLTNTTSHITHLTKHAMICYFIDKPPFLQDFHDWAEQEMHGKMNGIFSTLNTWGRISSSLILTK